MSLVYKGLATQYSLSLLWSQVALDVFVWGHVLVTITELSTLLQARLESADQDTDEESEEVADAKRR